MSRSYEKVVTFPAGQSPIDLPFTIARDESLLVFATKDCNETILCDGTDYMLADKSVAISADYTDSIITLAAAPRPELAVPKIGPIPADDQQAFADEIRDGFDYVYSQIQRSIKVPFGDSQADFWSQWKEITDLQTGFANQISEVEAKCADDLAAGVASLSSEISSLRSDLSRLRAEYDAHLLPFPVVPVPEQICPAEDRIAFPDIGSGPVLSGSDIPTANGPNDIFAACSIGVPQSILAVEAGLEGCTLTDFAGICDSPRVIRICAPADNLSITPFTAVIPGAFPFGDGPILELGNECNTF